MESSPRQILSHQPTLTLSDVSPSMSGKYRLEQITINVIFNLCDTNPRIVLHLSPISRCVASNSEGESYQTLSINVLCKFLSKLDYHHMKLYTLSLIILFAGIVAIRSKNES